MRWLWIGFFLFAAYAAHAHGTEQWIADKNLHDPVSKMFCCGPHDCMVLADGEVQEVTGGYQINATLWPYAKFAVKLSEFIPYSHAMPFSPDGRYHICVGEEYDSDPPVYKARCFIVPPGAVF
jgi:hypothetical protein